MSTSNYYLYDSRSTRKTIIVLHFSYNNKKLAFSTRQKALPKFWNKNRQRLKEVTQCPEAKSINQILSKIEVDVNNIYRELILTDISPSNGLLSARLKERMKIDSCRVKTPQITRLDFFTIMGKWIEDTESGKRLKKDGTLIKKSTTKGYRSLSVLLEDFSKKRKFALRLETVEGMPEYDLKRLKNYWNSLYHEFTDYLYKDRNNYDSAVGAKIKNLRVFFNYVKEQGYDIGSFHKSFYVTKEDIPVIALSPEQLSFLINNKEFEKKLTPKLKKVKDIFVFGCTTALRVSDLLSLTDENIVSDNGSVFLRARSIKTNTDTHIKLPDYAVNILNRYKDEYRTLLPSITDVKLNKYLKELGAMCAWNETINKKRNKRGHAQVIAKSDYRLRFHFSELITTHTMRRTAITTLLRLGVPERIVKQISGHSQTSSEFYKYVSISKSEVESELGKAFKKIS